MNEFSYSGSDESSTNPFVNTSNSHDTNLFTPEPLSCDSRKEISLKTCEQLKMDKFQRGDWLLEQATGSFSSAKSYLLCSYRRIFHLEDIRYTIGAF